MKRWLALISIFIWTASLAVPFVLPSVSVKAAPANTEDGEITFSAVSSSPGDVGDSIGSITYSGESTSSAWLYLKNLCGGETPNCTPRDIYVTFEATGTFDSPSYWDATLEVQYGAWLGTHKEIHNPCNVTRVHHGIWPDSAYGDCALSFTAVIPAEDIDFDADAQEYIQFWIDFVEGTFDIQFTVTFSTSAPGNCGQQYLAGNKFATVTLAGTNSAGVNISGLPSWPQPGGWVKAVVSGAWQNNGTGANQNDIAIQRMPVVTWVPLSEYPNTGCVDLVTHSYYFQVENNESHRLRVNDIDDNWANTGSVTVELYLVTTYTPFEASCEGQYSVSSLLESNSIMATSSWGVPIGTGISSDNPFGLGGESGPDDDNTNKDKRYLMLEVQGSFWDGIGYTSVAGINEGTSTYRIEEWPRVTCSNELDTLGRYRIYFRYDSGVREYLYKFLAYDFDDNRNNNTGTLGYSLYYADRLITDEDVIPPPDENGCAGYSHEATGTTLTLPAYNGDYGVSSTLTGGSLYAIETSGGPWVNNGVDDYSIGISDDNGATWYQLYEYPGIVCSESTDDQHYAVYLVALSGKSYHLRAEDAGSYTDNSGSINAIIYDGTHDSQWTPCSSTYLAAMVDIPSDARKIPAQNEDGIPIGYIQAGNIYGLEITDEHTWKPLGGPNELYTAQVSDDGGTSWYDMPSNHWSCAVYLSAGSGPGNARYRIYFTASGSYRIRVKGNNTIWPTNSGYLMYRLYKVDGTVDIPDPNQPPPDSDPYIPPEWGQACYTNCYRPTGLFAYDNIGGFDIPFGSLGTVAIPSIRIPLPDVAGWIEYGRCSIQKYLSWCPEHSAALAAAGDDVLDRYPFLYIYAGIDLFQYANDTINSYQWSSSQGAGGEITPPDLAEGGGEPAEQADDFLNTILPVQDETSPWNGGPITFDAPAIGGETTDCQLAFEDRFGETVTSVFCSISNLLDYISLTPKLRFYFNIGAVLLFAVWLYNYINRVIELLEKF